MGVSMKVAKGAGSVDENKSMLLRIVAFFDNGSDTLDVSPPDGGFTQMFEGHDATPELENEDFFLWHKTFIICTLHGKYSFVHKLGIAKSCQSCYSALVNIYHEQMLVRFKRTSILLTQRYGADAQAEGESNIARQTA